MKDSWQVSRSAISSTQLNCYADYPLLGWHSRAKFNKGIWFQPDEHQGSQQMAGS